MAGVNGTLLVLLLPGLLLFVIAAVIDDSRQLFTNDDDAPVLLLLGVSTDTVVTRLQWLALAVPLITSALGSTVPLLLLLPFFFPLPLLLFFEGSTVAAFVVLSREQLHPKDSWRVREGGGAEEEWSFSTRMTDLIEKPFFH